MPYFIIIPIYLILLILLGIAAAVTRRMPNIRWTSAYLAWGTIGTIPGFILANVIVNLLGILPLWITSHLSPPEWLQQLTSFVSIIALMLGPFIASAIGIILGFLAGCAFTRKRTLRPTPTP